MKIVDNINAADNFVKYINNLNKRKIPLVKTIILEALLLLQVFLKGLIILC